jgi:hypothetical protein
VNCVCIICCIYSRYLKRTWKLMCLGGGGKLRWNLITVLHRPILVTAEGQATLVVNCLSQKIAALLPCQHLHADWLLDVFTKQKERLTWRANPNFSLTVYLFVVWHQWLNRLLDIREIWCENSLQNLSSKHGFQENRSCDDCTELKVVNEVLIPHLSISVAAPSKA